MTKFIWIGLLLVSSLSFAFASDAGGLIHTAAVDLQGDEQWRLSRIQNAVDAFLKSQVDKAIPVLSAQISDLMRAGYKERGSTGAVVLGEECGFAGCTGTYLVTTVYFTPGVNRQSTIVAAIVAVGVVSQGVRVERILTRAEIERLVHPK
jgi:hypothetical protein